MLEWMLYVTAVSSLLAVGAAGGERAARLWGVPCRWMWLGALAGSTGLALVAPLIPTGPPSVALDVRAGGLAAAALTDGPGPILAATSDLRLNLPGLDRYLRLGWALLSLGGLATLAASAWGLRSQLRRCVPAKVNGRRVLLSDRLGPAVIGFVRPAIVLPHWVLDSDRAEREMILRHEEEHVFAGDQRLVALALLSLAVTPWNPALWWILHRLRQGIELDCDQRVLRGGRDPFAYAELILRASRQPSVRLGYGSPFGEPTVSLERRITAMVAPIPRFRSLRGAIAGASSALLIVAAFAIDRPTVADAAGAGPAQAPGGIDAPALRQDPRVAVNRVSAAPDRAADRDVIVLEVKAGPAYALNGIAVSDLRSFVAELYAPRPRKVLFVQAETGVPDREVAAAVDAARRGLGEALDAEKEHGGPGLSATINVVAAPAP